MAPEPSSLDVARPGVKLPVDATTPMALVLHELATNALKYGAWSREGGRVTVTWTVPVNLLKFQWREHNGPTLAPPVREGLGRSLIKNSLPGARVEHSFRPDGLECEIDLALTKTEG